MDTCKDKVADSFRGVEEDYKNARDYYNLSSKEWQKKMSREHDQYDGYEDLYDYVSQTALSWDYVEKGTFNDQERGYFRLQLSWGGPGDEFRIYTDYDKSIDYIEYWYLDWYDGACVNVSRDSVSWDICSWYMDLELEVA